MKAIKAWLLLIIFMVPVLVYAQSGITHPDGSYRNTTPKDFKAKNLSSAFYNELWTYHINLDNGVQVIYTFSINDFGSFKSRVTGVKLSVSWTDGKTYVVNKEYGPETFINEPDSMYIRPHPDRTYWAKGKLDDEHRLFFYNIKKGVQYDLDLTLFDIAPGKTIGNGVYKAGDNEIGMALLIPHAKVKGFVAINGDTLNVTGSAYMDHIYQNNLSTKVIDRSYRVKTGDAQNGMYFHYITLSRDGNSHIPIGFGIRYKQGRDYLITPSSIERVSSHPDEKLLDEYIKVKPYQTDMLNIRVDEYFNTYSILDEIGGIKKFFAKKALGGELFEMNGTVTINGNQPGYFYYMVAD
ncbi:carotenoid 1,2-hydratase [Gracilimonas mengyeensis]|uniref:Hydroxyneurosporene synthase (CrtC) n=1 Tax=Gracilimonas mengyeensis TaxID=1302730 RepID=A0A521AFE7_9BACT|nr:carotenoid 1,2-hydratase [Gracilimonas mengyeensis]SMO33430.1 hypothetical protein SAMN06265219_10197 [Gracilimonas mengyeensis]